MNIHEYQAKEILRGYGVPLLPGRMADTVEDAETAAEDLGGPVWVVKAQIHAGGRGKAGGVKLARSREEVRTLANGILGRPLVTHQTGPAGQTVRRLYIESAIGIEREMYLALTVDRTRGAVCFLAAAEGGVEIEESGGIAAFAVDPAAGYSPYIGGRIVSALRLTGYAAKQCRDLTKALYDAFVARDMSLLEINPLVQTDKGELFALDAKIAFDDNARFRHPELEDLRDKGEEDPAEAEAERIGVSFIKLDGTIGCMVNGAGLAMATMDIIKLYGEEPANFLDVGGGATAEQVAGAFRLILADAKVRGILINIFGGIMKCDVIAEGIIAAMTEVRPKVPVVVRLAGTHVERGKALLAASGLDLVAADDLADAAQKIAEAVGKAKA